MHIVAINKILLFSLTSQLDYTWWSKPLMYSSPAVCSEINNCLWKNWNYCNDPKFSDTQNNFCNHSKVWTMWLNHRLMSPNDADGMANSVDPDQTAPLGAVWSGSALFAQAYLSENLGSLRYKILVNEKFRIFAQFLTKRNCLLLIRMALARHF